MLPVHKMLILASVATALAGGAHAADPANYDPAPETYADPAFQWGGAYIGAHGGLTSPKLNPFADGKGFTGGAQAGYNFQFGPGIVGAELEGSWLGGSDTAVRGGKLEQQMRGAAKARAGLTFDRTLVYGTAGVTMTKFKDGKGASAPDSWQQGYLFGGGIERGFAGGLSARIEYNRVLTDDVKTRSGGVTSRSDLRDNVFKAGVNYRF